MTLKSFVKRLVLSHTVTFRITDHENRRFCQFFLLSSGRVRTVDADFDKIFWLDFFHRKVYVIILILIISQIQEEMEISLTVAEAVRQGRAWGPKPLNKTLANEQ